MVLFLPCALVLGASMVPRAVEACGPYDLRGSGEHDMVVHVLAATAPSSISVHAKCGDEYVFAKRRDDGAFELRGLPGGACTIEAFGYELDAEPRTASRRVQVPKKRVVISLPEAPHRLA